ncbi:MAG: OsmC family protein [Gammaproteobacteria bacterium]|nr:OsmC family protein [Gammaproteobacteria bacterium]
MKAQIKWVDGAMFVAESESGHAVVIDGPADGGGRNMGPRPMELVLMGTGACSTYDVVSILRKARQDIIDCQVELSAERADAVPAVFTAIHMHFIVRGRQLAENQVARAVKLSAEKYCSASIMLGAAGVKVTHSHAVEEA